VGEREDRVYIYESFDVEDENQMIDTIRFLVSACGCDFIFLDHISWLATGMENEDERKKLDRISQKLKLLAKELRFCLIMISHTNDDGKTRGSRNISKVANTVIHLTRDKVSPSLEERNKMYYTIEKARTGGNTGPAGVGVFDRETMMLIDGNQVFEQVDIKEAMRA
jgi:replicative DNA helicase